MLIGRRERSR